jgi:hypothetical protein
MMVVSLFWLPRASIEDCLVQVASLQGSLFQNDREGREKAEKLPQRLAQRAAGPSMPIRPVDPLRQMPKGSSDLEGSAKHFARQRKQI